MVFSEKLRQTEDRKTNFIQSPKLLIQRRNVMSTIQNGSLQLNSPGSPVTTGGDTSSFTTVPFPTPFPDGSNVIVIPMVQTFNGQDTPGVRIADVTTTEFKIRMNELVGNGQALSDGGHINETIGWVAFSI